MKHSLDDSGADASTRARATVDAPGRIALGAAALAVAAPVLLLVQDGAVATGLALPCLAWVAARTGWRGAAAGVVLLGLAGAYRAHAGPPLPVAGLLASLATLPLVAAARAHPAVSSLATALESAEAALRDEERRHSVLLRTAIDGVHVVDAEGCLVEANDAFLRHLGYEREQAAGLHVSDWDAQWNRGELAAKIDELLTDHGVFETRHRRRDGSIVEVEISTTHVEIGGRQLLFCASRDITERKRIESALRASEERWKFALEGSGDGVWDWNVQTDRVFYSRRWKEVLGHAEHEIGDTLAERETRVHPDDLPLVRAQLERHLHGATPVYVSEHRMRYKDGSYRWVLDRGMVVGRTPEGTPLRVIGTHTDVTWRRVAEEQLARSHRELATLLDALPGHAFYKDAHGVYVTANRRYCRVVGVERAAIAGLTDLDLFPRDTAERYRAEDRAVLESGEPATIEEEVEFEGRRVTVSTRKVPLRNERGEIHGLIGLAIDVTHRKRTEDDLRRTTERLAAANRELETSIARANELAVHAERANHAKSEFLANMSHEIRTPLNGVIGMTDMLLDTDLTAEQRDYAEVVRRSGTTLLGLLNDVLDLSKVEAGRLELEEIGFELRGLVQDAAEMLALAAHAKGIGIAWSVAPDLEEHLRGDPGRLRQVLANLVGNAVKFTERGEVAVHAEAAGRGAGSVEVRFAVTDTGIGVPRHRLAELFEPFTQADSSTTRRFGGTGLGLSIAKKLSERMGGRIGAESEEGRGSTFWCTVPLRLDDAPASPAERVTAPRGGVLVATSSPGLRRSLTTLLDHRGWRCAVAPDAADAAGRLRAARAAGDGVALVLVDRALAAGAALATALREDATLGDTPLVWMVPFGAREDDARAREAGFDAQIVKPVDRAELFALLDRVGRSVATATDAAAAGSGSRPADAGRGRFRVLVAEDNPVNQRIALALLGRLGFRADAVGNGAEALRALTRARYDLVLMDCQMPEMDGFQATAALRRGAVAGVDPALPVVAMTAHALAGDRERCLSAGMDDYVAKPVQPSMLADLLDRWLLPHAPAGAPRCPGTPAPQRTRA